MSKRKKKKNKEIKLVRGKPVDPLLLKARNLRSSLLRRISPELKDTTPTVQELYKWLNAPHHTCYYSLQDLKIEDLTVDHKIPLTRNGTNELSNLCYCSASMNSIKGELTEEEFREFLELCKKWDEKIRNNFFARLQRGNNVFGMRR